MLQIFKICIMETQRCLKNLLIIIMSILLMFLSDSTIYSSGNVYLVFVLVLASIFWIIHRILISETEV